MSITDTVFIFVFLPISLVIYYMSKESLREYILLIFSLIFYACWSFRHFVLLLFSSLVNVCIGRLISISNGRKKNIFLISGIIYNLSVLGYYKYTDLILNRLQQLSILNNTRGNLLLPMGLSFFAFKAVSYLIDIAHDKIDAQNPVHTVLYLSFFPQVQSGPLSRYNDMQRNCPVHNRPDARSVFQCYAGGASRFMIGFQKKILLANTFSRVTAETFAVSPEHMSAAYAWLGAFCYSLQLFFDFSGYSDMAIGITQMFGFRCPENFDYPYMADSFSRFWRKWHITLGAWFRDYVYIPLGGSCVKKPGHLYRNLFIVWILTGLWHGASWNFICWGMAYFILVAFEKCSGWPEKIKFPGGRILYRIFVLFSINFLWVIFRAEGIRMGIWYIGCMFGSTADAVADQRALFLLKDNLGFLLAAIFLCFPVVPWISAKAENKPVLRIVWNFAYAGINMFLFLWAVSMIITKQNNPFLYADF